MPRWRTAGHQELVAADIFLLDSDHVGDTLEVSITVIRRPADGEPISVVYALDPIFTLRPAASAAQMLDTFAALTGRPFPPLAVVGVGYPDHEPRAVIGRRARDLTPTADGFPAEIGTPPFPYGFGGAARLLAALTDEVLPAVEAHLPSRPVDRTLTGLSFGGLFGLYTLFHRPEAFDRYLLVSPSIWWDDRVVLRYEEAWAQTHTDLPADLFLAVGEHEQGVGGTWLNESFSAEALRLLRQVDNFRELVGRLRSRGYPSLRLEAAILPDEYHLSVLPAAVTRGLLALFGRAGT
jgi:predicted alpha/beta superfamily hydrolase